MSTLLGIDLLIEFNAEGNDELIGPGLGASLVNPNPQLIPLINPVLILELQNLNVEVSS